MVLAVNQNDIQDQQYDPKNGGLISNALNYNTMTSGDAAANSQMVATPPAGTTTPTIDPAEIVAPIAAPVTTPDAPTVQVNQETDTTAGQMTGLLSQGSQYMTVARENAKREAAKRGLASSSIAVGAGEKAAIESALPIAKQDAATYAQAALANQQAATNMILQKLQSDTQLSIADLDAATRIMGIQMDNDHKLMMQELVEDNKRALQSDASISTAFSNTMNSIGQAYQNPEMSVEQQRAAAEFFMSSFKSYVEFQDITGGSNYADQFDWGAWDRTKEEVAADQGAAELQPFGIRGSEGERRRFDGSEYEWTRGRWEKIQQRNTSLKDIFGQAG